MSTPKVARRQPTLKAVNAPDPASLTVPLDQIVIRDGQRFVLTGKELLWLLSFVKNLGDGDSTGVCRLDMRDEGNMNLRGLAEIFPWFRNVEGTSGQENHAFFLIEGVSRIIAAQLEASDDCDTFTVQVPRMAAKAVA